jgi:hypothetical protein
VKRQSVAINPLMVIAAKNRIPQEDAELIELGVLICLDEVKRGKANNSVANRLTEHLATIQALWGEMTNRALYDQSVKSWGLWCKACNRDPSRPIALTTGEYQAVRQTISYFVRSLTKLEAGRLVSAKRTAVNYLNAITQEAA